MRLEGAMKAASSRIFCKLLDFISVTRYIMKTVLIFTFYLVILSYVKRVNFQVLNLKAFKWYILLDK